MRATAVAQPNIALIKYWGKANEELIIPSTGSISLTLDQYPTTTTVTLQPEANTDTATLNDEALSGVELDRITAFLQHVRNLAGVETRAHVSSTNTVPTAAGLASSASGFAALATAACAAYHVQVDKRDLSRIARRGSGSAARSIFGGVVRWEAGEDDASSYAQPLDWRGPELRLVVARVSTARKSVSSREGMRRTIETSPFYEGWVRSNRELVLRASEAIAHGDLQTLGALTELSTMRMHASMLGAEPPLRYLEARSFALFDAISALRDRGVEAWATADAGPNVKILTTAADVEQVIDCITSEFPELEHLVSGVGGGAHLAQSEHR